MQSLGLNQHKTNVLFLQVKDFVVGAIGGFYHGSGGKLVYPGIGRMTWRQDGGWQKWTEEEEEEERGRQRDGFMEAQVPLSWLEIRKTP